MMVRPFLVLAALSAACGSDDGGASVDAATGGDAVGNVKRVFVTAADFTGGFASGNPGVDGAVVADQQCQTAAVGAGMSGTWHAWMGRYGNGSLPARTAPERVTGDGPWHLTGTNELVFLNRAALANTPRVAIDRNEHGVMVASGPVWTATDVGGALVGFDCQSWTTGNSAYDGTVGELSSNGSQWTYTGNFHGCELRARLYCFEM